MKNESAWGNSHLRRSEMRSISVWSHVSGRFETQILGTGQGMLIFPSGSRRFMNIAWKHGGFMRRGPGLWVDMQVRHFELSVLSFGKRWLGQARWLTHILAYICVMAKLHPASNETVRLAFVETCACFIVSSSRQDLRGKTSFGDSWRFGAW
jgi:hypothetical protein